MERAIKHFIDTRSFERIEAETFFSGSEERIFNLRREMTKQHLDGERVYVCGKCFSPIYVAFNHLREGYLKHYPGQLSDCPWYTGESASPDEVDAARFQGRQESPLHKRLKAHVESRLSSDNQCYVLGVEAALKGTNTEGHKFPDVFAMFQEHRIAFEVQLATTQMPTLVGKEEFYRKNGVFVLWMFWDFEANSDRVSAKDAFYHNKENAFSLDRAAIEEGERRGRLVLRAHWRQPYVARDDEVESRWESRLVELSNLRWDHETFKPYYFDVPNEKARLTEKIESDRIRREAEARAEKLRVFEEKWYARRTAEGFGSLTVEADLLEPIWHHVNDGYSSNLTADQWIVFGKVLDRLYSLRDGRVIGSKETLPGAINTALEAWPDYTSYIIDIATAYSRSDLLARTSVQSKIIRNLARRMNSSSFAFRCDKLIRYLFSEYRRCTIHKIN